MVGKFMPRNLLYDKFMGHKYNAEGNGVRFELTFDEWLQIWTDSGFLDQRGQGKYVMARLGDKGPYAVGNVKIITAAENVREAWLNKTPEEVQHWKDGAAKGGLKNKGRARPDLSEFNRSRRGQPRTPESIEKSRVAQIGMKRSDETKAKIGAAIKRARTRSPWNPMESVEAREQLSIKIKAAWAEGRYANRKVRRGE
jgi:hypothetical protein